MMKRVLLLTITALVPMTASAEPVIDQVGARIGGYGFREGVDAAGQMSSETGWQACRMNGIGVFASRNLTRHFFLEGALDTYFTDNDAAVLGSESSSYDTPIDRVSGILSVAAGARVFPDAIVSPYVQLGLGGEVTRVRLPEVGMQDTALLPMGFFGVGANLRLGSRLRFTAVVKVNVMGYYDDAQFQDQLDAKAELATQGQFALSYQL
jgi:hypothetical protein